LWNGFVKFLKSILNIGRETVTKKAESIPEPGQAGFDGRQAMNADSGQKVTAANSNIQDMAQPSTVLQDHYSLNTDYVSLRADNTITSTEYTMNSADSGMWQSSTEPTPSSPGTDGMAHKSKVTSSDNNRWTTDYYTTPNQDDGRFNYQMYKFKVTEPKQSLYSFKILWEGYGEPTSGYNVSLSLWNFTQSRWDELKNQYIPSETTVTLIKSKDYKPFCLKCHDGAPPAGVQLGPYTRNISTTYAGDYHGDLTGVDDPGSTIKLTYSRGVTLPCVDCHDLHGSQNAYHLRENVNGTSNLSVPSMTVVDKYDTSKNAAILTYCQSCHAGTLDNFHMAKCLYCHRDPGAHDCAPPTAGDFSRACTYCHTHGGYMPDHGLCHCTLGYNAKAF